MTPSAGRNAPSGAQFIIAGAHGPVLARGGKFGQRNNLGSYPEYKRPAPGLRWFKWDAFVRH